MSTTDLREQLQEIYDRHSDLTPSIVVDEARDPSHPLHSRFEWDDSVAGEAWRRHQAHELITSVKIAYRAPSGDKREIRAFHAVPRQDRKQPAYEPADSIVEDPIKTKIVLAQMEREWRTLKLKYEHFSEFYEMIRKDLVA